MIEITWLGHGTFFLRLESGEGVLIDPWIEENPSYPDEYELGKVDVILVTHGHFDHISDCVEMAKKHNAPVGSNFEISQWLKSKGVKDTYGGSKGGTLHFGSALQVTLTHAIHGSAIQDGDELIYGGEPCGFILTFADGRRAYFAGDTNVFSDMALIQELYEPDLAFLPIGDVFTMSPKEAAVACRLLKVKKVIPMHFGTFPALIGRPDDLAERVKPYGTEIWTLEPGQTVQW